MIRCEHRRMSRYVMSASHLVFRLSLSPRSFANSVQSHLLGFDPIRPRATDILPSRFICSFVVFRYIVPSFSSNDVYIFLLPSSLSHPPREPARFQLTIADENVARHNDEYSLPRLTFPLYRSRTRFLQEIFFSSLAITITRAR